MQKNENKVVLTFHLVQKNFIHFQQKFIHCSKNSSVSTTFHPFIVFIQHMNETQWRFFHPKVIYILYFLLIKVAFGQEYFLVVIFKPPSIVGLTIYILLIPFWKCLWNLHIDFIIITRIFFLNFFGNDVIMKFKVELSIYALPHKS